MWSNKIDAEEGILDVPHPALLRYHTAEDIALQFEPSGACGRRRWASRSRRRTAC